MNKAFVIMEAMNNGIYIFNIMVLFFAILIMGSYISLALISSVSLRRYVRENQFINYSVLLSSNLGPEISIIAPAYNEGKTIKENIQSMLSLNYHNYEVIVVNDGSKDNTMDLLISAYDLEKTNRPIAGKIQTKEIKGIYKSKNPAYAKLYVVDKYNGGKADALNVGLNIAVNPYVVCIDVDCVMDKDALLKLAKPFMEESGKKIIAIGGVIRIINSCLVKGGRLVEIKAPQKFLPRIQVIEYLRAFLLGRMAWGKMDGLLLISGAFGMFDRKIAIECGGYNHSTVGEDMELVVRMRRYMIERKKPYKVSFIPDPLCWTEAPDSFKILKRQRSRWTRGTMETLWIHKKMFFNPKYKLLGMLSVPYWFFFEYLAPLVEFSGLLITILFAFLGIISLKFFFLLWLFVYTFAVMFSVFSLITEEFTYRQYTKISDFSKLFFIALLEPIYFHPFTVYCSIKGNIEKIRGTKGWGDMVRKGFSSGES